MRAPDDSTANVKDIKSRKGRCREREGEISLREERCESQVGCGCTPGKSGCQGRKGKARPPRLIMMNLTFLLNDKHHTHTPQPQTLPLSVFCSFTQLNISHFNQNSTDCDYQSHQSNSLLDRLVHPLSVRLLFVPSVAQLLLDEHAAI